MAWAGGDTRVSCIDGALWWSNGRVMVRVEPSLVLVVEGFHDQASAEALVRGYRGEPCRFTARYDRVVELNGGVYDARYVDAVRRLYPGCSWSAPPGIVARRGVAAFALLDGQPVALLAPMRDEPRPPW
jgi:hypothetical protein